MLNAIGYFVILLGVALNFISILGIVRMKDFYNKIHFASISDSLGSIFIIIGAFIITFDIKLLLLIVIVMINHPTATNLLVNAFKKHL